jgi:tripartite-type tricarboxylate transporter receptor subunit TctC
MRALAEATGKHLGQPVIAENKTGGGGTVGPATMAATAKPDGYTVTMMHIAIFRYPYMMKVTWDPLKDFTYILNIAGFTYGVVVKSDSPWKTWNDFINYAKANPGKITYATPGAGTTLHIMMEVIAMKEGIKWIQVPMKGGSETTPAVLGGHVSATADSTSWGPQVDSGELRLLVTWGAKRTKRWPNVPTLKELGYDIVSTPPLGIAGPKGMDSKVVKVLHDAFKKGTEEPSFQNILAKFDMEPNYIGTADYGKFVKEQCELEKMYIEKMGLGKK